MLPFFSFLTNSEPKEVKSERKRKSKEKEKEKEGSFHQKKFFFFFFSFFALLFLFPPPSFDLGNKSKKPSCNNVAKFVSDPPSFSGEESKKSLRR